MNIHSGRLADAWRFAVEHHETDYLHHLGRVALEVAVALEHEPAEDGELSLLCAILHDSIEDTPVTRADVARSFGEQVAAGVDALSKRPEHPEPMKDSIARILQCSKAVWKVKLADRCVNLDPPPRHWDRAKCQAYHAQAGDILAALGPASPVLAARLQAKCDRYPSFWPQV